MAVAGRLSRATPSCDDAITPAAAESDDGGLLPRAARFSGAVSPCAQFSPPRGQCVQCATVRRLPLYALGFVYTRDMLQHMFTPADITPAYYFVVSPYDVDD